MVCKKTANYLHRKSTVFKRAKELSTLCDVDVLLILYDPDSPNIPQTWCSRSDPVTVIDQYYAKKKPNRSKEVIPSRAKNDDQFLQNLGFGELNDLNSILAAKIESVNQRINLIKEGNKARDLIDCGKTGLYVEDLGCEGNNLADSSSRFVDDVTEFKFSNGINEGNKLGFSNFSESLDFGFGFEGKTDCIDYNDGLNVGDLEFQDSDDLMIDISDLNDIKFVEDDLQLINRLATVQDVASASEFLCY
ncbi:agamous-like MADS-box protein AGL90 [Silene latifolia]|uniref:agamous-like MADS-box protein AGL90 n=1 Tax=Silene latifolia TaxID=37657 RepID=UPI003D784103